MLEGDDDAVSLLQEKEIDNLAGKAHAAARRALAGSRRPLVTGPSFISSAFPTPTFYFQRQVGLVSSVSRLTAEQMMIINAIIFFRSINHTNYVLMDVGYRIFLNRKNDN